jgi:N,N'-diacetyllegionaminate synthase
MKEMDLPVDQKLLGSGSKVFVIAEIGINHDGSVHQAERLIDAATEAGADAVKFQSFRVDRLLIPSRDRYAQQTEGMESAYQMLRRYELSWQDQAMLKKHADRKGVIFLSTPFDEESADFLDSLGVPLFKIASSDITHMPLLSHVASKGKPILLSTGMSFLDEVAEAISNLKSSGAKEIVLMHCVSVYPALPQDMNLRALQTLRSSFNLPVGLSDHSEGILLPVVAASLGAVAIEKHFTLDKTAPGPDHKASMDPADLKMLIKNLRDVEASLGNGTKQPTAAEIENRHLSRRSIVAAVDIPANETIAPWMLSCKRPGTGLDPRHWKKVLGMTARRNVEMDTILQWEDLTPSRCSQSDQNDQKMEPMQSRCECVRMNTMHEINILITAASRRVPLIQAFVQALKRLGVKGNVITTDMNNLSPGLYFGTRHYIVPLTTDAQYIPMIKSICFRERIHLLIPTIDDELPIFGKHFEDFRAMGIRVAVSNERTGLICNDKYSTAQFLLEKGIPFARTWLPSELNFSELQYPLFLKPRSGRGSVGAFMIQNERELRFFLSYVQDPIVQEFLEGKEFTIDLLVDFEGQVISVVPRERMVVRSGVTDRGRTVNHPGLIELAIRAAEALDIRGPANIQVKLQNESATMFEVNPRFSGGIPLTIAAGADFPRWLIEMCCGRSLRPAIGKFIDGLIMACYETAIYFDNEVKEPSAEVAER